MPTAVDQQVGGVQVQSDSASRVFAHDIDSAIAMIQLASRSNDTQRISQVVSNFHHADP
jgi:hypothetical protein